MRIKIGGVVRTVHSTSVMAKKIGKSTATIRRWEKDEIIPTPVFRDALGRRYYFVEEIEVLVDLLEEFSLQGSGRKPKPEFTRRLIVEWSRCRGQRAKTASKVGSDKSSGVVDLW